MRIFACLGVVCIVCPNLVFGGGALRLRNRVIDPAAAAPPAGHHMILQFRTYPGPETRAALAERGIRVLGYIPDSGLMVSSATPPDLEGLDVILVGGLLATDKISPDLDQGPRNAFLVMMQPDVPAPAARELFRRWGFTPIDQPGLLPGDFVVIGPYRGIFELAASDDVAYIMPPSVDLLSGSPVTGCAGAVTEAGPVAQYVAVGASWPKDSSGNVALSYTFETLGSKLDPSAQQSEIGRALAEWSKYANVNFGAGAAPSGPRTVDIKFANGAHGDGYPFDASGKVLAHTFYPVPLNPEPIAGDMHFNAAENWAVGANTDVFSVALHEAGHALGLGHVDKPSAVMYPYYHFVTGLAADDIAGIQALYGSRTAAPQPPAQPPSTPVPAPPTQPPAAPPAPPPTPRSGGSDTTPPSLSITTPGSSIASALSPSISIAGRASDNVGVTAVRWSTSTGSSGTASGTTAWSAVVPLLVGDNVVTVRAYDAAGNSAWRALTVVRH
jgi:hypothetical protein